MKYEAVIVFKPELNEEQVDALIAKYQKLLDTLKLGFTTADKWGKRPLMCRFKKFQNTEDANYVKMNFEVESLTVGESIRKLNYQLKIDDNVIRYMVCRVEEPKIKHMPSSVEMQSA